MHSIYDEDIRPQSAHYKSLNEKKQKDQNHGKPYGNPSDKGKHKADQKATCGKERRGTSASVRCFKCGKFGHRIFQCRSTSVNLFKCGKPCHRDAEFKSISLTCYNCGEQSHISTQCEKPKKTQYGGEVFSLSGAETTASNNLI